MAYHSPPHAPFVGARGSIHSISGSRKGSYAKESEDDELLGFPKDVKTNFATDYGPPPLEDLKQQEDVCYGYFDTYPQYEKNGSVEWGAVKLCVILMGMVVLLVTFGYYWIFIHNAAAGGRKPPLVPPLN